MLAARKKARAAAAAGAWPRRKLRHDGNAIAAVDAGCDKGYARRWKGIRVRTAATEIVRHNSDAERVVEFPGHRNSLREKWDARASASDGL